MVIARVDRDYLTKALEGEDTRLGTEWTDEEIRERYNLSAIDYEFPKTRVRWRVKDDDGEKYYGGWLLDDTEGLVQLAIGQWAMHDAGAVVIEVKRNGEWKVEVDI